jgi:hypothetical protein
MHVHYTHAHLLWRNSTCCIAIDVPTEQMHTSRLKDGSARHLSSACTCMCTHVRGAYLMTPLWSTVPAELSRYDHYGQHCTCGDLSSLAASRHFSTSIVLTVCYCCRCWIAAVCSAGSSSHLPVLLLPVLAAGPNVNTVKSAWLHAAMMPVT